MKHATATAVLGLAVAFAGLGCESQETVTLRDGLPPEYTGAVPGKTTYRFVYHADDNVYYEPYTKVFHWYADDAWHTGAELPEAFTLHARSAVIVDLASDKQPWWQHEHVRQAWPNPREIDDPRFDPDEGEGAELWRLSLTEDPPLFVPRPTEDEAVAGVDTDAGN